MSDPDTNTVQSSVTKVVRKRYKWLLAIVGVPGVGDLVREYARGKAIDWVASKLSSLGRLGDFIVANPVALTLIGVVTALIVLAVMVVTESSKEIPSPIFEHRDKPFTKPPAPLAWRVGFVVIILIVVVVVCLGTYKYWLRTSRHPDTAAFASTGAMTPAVPSPPVSKNEPQALKQENRTKNQLVKKIIPLTSGDSPTEPTQQNKQQIVASQPAQASTQTETTPLSQAERVVQTDRNLPKGDRERLTDAFFEFSQVLDQASTAWGKANHLKADEKGPLLKDLATRKSKIAGIESAAKEFEKHFYQARQQWRYYGDQIIFIFGDDPDNHALILRNAVDEYAQQLDSVLALSDTDEAKLKIILRPEDIRYDDAIMRFAQWKVECEGRLENAKRSVR